MQIARFRYFEAGPNGAGIWGRGGAAITTDGRVMVETGDGAFDPTGPEGRFCYCTFIQGSEGERLLHAAESIVDDEERSRYEQAGGTDIRLKAEPRP
jgi:hypothetical protein